jgi:hypothetical protein
MGKTLMTPEEYAIKEQVSLKTVYNRINSGKLKTEKKFKKMLIVV